VQLDGKQTPIILPYSLFYKAETVLSEAIFDLEPTKFSTKSIIWENITIVGEHPLCKSLRNCTFFRHYGGKFDIKVVLEELYELHSKDGKLHSKERNLYAPFCDVTFKVV